MTKKEVIELYNVCETIDNLTELLENLETVSILKIRLIGLNLNEFDDFGIPRELKRRFSKIIDEFLVELKTKYNIN